MRTIRRKLNIVPGGIPVLIKLNQYDSDYSLVFELYSTDGVFTVPSGSTAKICGTKRSGTGYSADASISGTTVTVTGDVQMTAAAGTNVYEIVLYNGTKKLHTSNIILLVERAALDADTITDDTVLRELNAIIEGAETATRAADRAEAAAASIDFGLDVTPTQGSSNAVSSGGVYDYLDEISAIDAKTINYNSMGKLLAYINWSRHTVAADSYTRVAYFRCQVNTEYTINKVLSEKFRVGYTTDLPADNVSVYNIKEDVSATTMKYTTGADATYVVIYYYDSHVDTLDETDIFNSFVVTYDEELTAVDKTARTAIADGLSETIKQALLACFQQVAWINEHGQDYYDALEDALYASSAHHTITNTLTHCTTSNMAVSIGDNKSYSATLTPDTDYAITYVQVIMGGTNITSTAYNSTTNEINIAHVTDDITIVGFGYSLWHMDTNDAHSLIVLKQGGLNKTGNYVYANSGNTIDRTSVVTRVKSSPQPLGICNSSGTPTGEISDFYLIPVPSTATGVNTTILSSGNVVLLQCYTANADGTYTVLGTLDYQTSTPGRASYTFPEAVLNALQGDTPVVLFYLSRYADGKWYSDDPSYRPTRATIDFVST